MAKILGYCRIGSWQAARTFVKQNIGTRYDADFKRWLVTGRGDDDSSTTPPPTGSRYQNNDVF